MKTYKKLKTQLLKDKEIKQAYEKLGPEFNFITVLIKKRLESGLTQAALAQKIKTKQSAISRLESGNYNPSLAFLQKVAKALKCQLEVEIH
jgi:ribosome-binding protein aMBF1 (putative translation factor)